MMRLQEGRNPFPVVAGRPQSYLCLSGDIEHTHLVKGLEYALLNKIRSEIDKKLHAEDEKDGNMRMLSSARVVETGEMVHKAKEKNPVPSYPDVEMYQDERGHLRVSIVRGLGISMTWVTEFGFDERI